MSLEEMAAFLAREVPHGDCYGCGLSCIDAGSCKNAWIRYLESDMKSAREEVDDDE